MNTTRTHHPEAAMTYPTKREAIAAARELREQGKTVRIFRSEGVYTQPGRGIEAFVSYFLEVA